MSDQPDLKTMIDASVAATKPRFGAIEPDRLADFIRGQTGARAVTLSNIRGSSELTGASSGIVLFSAAINGVSRDYVLRYAPTDNPLRIFFDYNIAGQFAVQHKLARAGLPVPDTHWADPEGAALGLPAFVMEAAAGEVAHASAFTGGLFAETDDAGRSAMFDRVLAAQHTIHEVDWRALGLDRDVCAGPGRTPIERYIAYFWQTAEWVKPFQIERLAAVRDWLVRNQPDYHVEEYRLVHGDPGLGNYMFAGGKIVAIIDWELSGIVHPTYDLAMHCALSDFFRASAAPEVAAIIPTSAAWLARYTQVTGRTPADFANFQKLVTLPSLIVSLSMNRGMPPGMRAGHLQMIEAIWQQAEAG